MRKSICTDNPTDGNDTSVKQNLVWLESLIADKKLKKANPLMTHLSTNEKAGSEAGHIRSKLTNAAVTIATITHHIPSISSYLHEPFGNQVALHNEQVEQ